MWKYIICILLVCFVWAEERTYRQVSDVAAKQSGRIEKSSRSSDMFEFVYDIDRTNGVIIRKSIRRLDQDNAITDATKYIIRSERTLVQSNAGTGGQAIVAIDENGAEIIQLGDDFAFTSRTSDFSQMITGVYKRVR